MITVTIPNTYIPEREYTFSVLLGEMLGLAYKIEIGPEPNYLITLSNGHQVVIEDHFFSQFSEGSVYLKPGNIPENIIFTSNLFTQDLEIPVIYGTGEMTIRNNIIICGIDIIASSFFMLSRWEEFVTDERDMHGRFPAVASLAFKKGFLLQPVVNMYVEMLWNIFVFLRDDLKRKESFFSFILTHDVDALLKWLNWRHVLKTAAADILKRRKPLLAITRIKEYMHITQGKISDPFDSFEFLMNQADQHGLTAHFYFMCGGLSESPQDNHSAYPPNHPFLNSIISCINSRSHITGFHPGYSTLYDEPLWEAQRLKLEKYNRCSLTEGRQHYLRFQVPHTWQLWENQNMQMDSTCGYSECEGFRCGTGTVYPVFNILTRQKLNLKEQPLVFMDSTDCTCDWHSPSPRKDRLMTIIEAAKTWRTNVTLLFHNSSFADDSVRYMYEEILNLS